MRLKSMEDVLRLESNIDEVYFPVKED